MPYAYFYRLLYYSTLSCAQTLCLYRFNKIQLNFYLRALFVSLQQQPAKSMQSVCFIEFKRSLPNWACSRSIYFMYNRQQQQQKMTMEVFIKFSFLIEKQMFRLQSFPFLEQTERYFCFFIYCTFHRSSDLMRAIKKPICNTLGNSGRKHKHKHTHIWSINLRLTNFSKTTIDVTINRHRKREKLVSIQ